MAKQNSHHVVPRSNGGWDIRKAGSDRASKHCGTKNEAVERAREISQNQGSELYIHGKDGRIQQKDSHGKDPFPPKDRV